MKVYKLLPLSVLEILYRFGFPIQQFTVYHLASLLVFPLILLKHVKISKIVSLLIAFYLYFLINTLIHILLHITCFGDVDFYPVFRQLFGMTLGIITFIVLRSGFEINPFRSLRLVLYSLYLILLFILMFDIILNGRFYRLYGSFTEPSHLGQYLVFIVIPSILLLDNISTKRKYIMLSITILIILFTFSLSTYIRLILFLLLYSLLGNFKEKIKYFILILTFLILSFGTFTMLFKDSYVTVQLTKNLEFLIGGFNIENATASLLDRIQFLYIIKSFFESLGINAVWGIGAGLEKYYMHLLYQTELLDVILSVKAVPSYITSFWAKILLYGGFIGCIIFATVLLQSVKVLMKIIDIRSRNIVLSVLLSVYIYAFFGLGPFQSIELWFWIAFVDGYYHYYRRRAY